MISKTWSFRIGLRTEEHL